MVRRVFWPVRLGLVGLVVGLVGVVWFSVGAWGSSGEGVVVVEDAGWAREGEYMVFPVRAGADASGSFRFRASVDSSATLGTDFGFRGPPGYVTRLGDGWYRMSMDHMTAAEYNFIVVLAAVDEVFEGPEDVVLEVVGENGLNVTPEQAVRKQGWLKRARGTGH